MKIVDGWIDVAVEVDYLDKTFGDFTRPPKFIVIHGTSNPAPAVNQARYFATPGVEVSTHIIIDKDGTIVQGLPITKTCWGQGNLTDGHAPYLPEGINPNLYTVGIEHVKNDGNYEEITSAQKKASFETIKTICDVTGIPLAPGSSKGGIIRHADIDPRNRSGCPGPYPFDELFRYGGNMSGTPTEATDKEFYDCWSSTKQLFGGLAPRNNTGIYDSWRKAWLSGHQFGPPLSQEYPLTVFGGAGDVCQEFAHARCEWVNGVPHWYSISGEITF